jgi:predicted DNA-binding WGR domain protein
MRTFVFKDAKSNNFWNIELDGNVCRIHYGRVGTKGKHTVKHVQFAPNAQEVHDKLIAEKLAKGYVETTPK